MLDNYFNPNSMSPQGSWKPVGFLAGMHYGDDRERQQQAYDLQRQVIQQGLMEQQEKHGDWRLNAPVRNAQRELDIPRLSLERMLVQGRTNNAGYVPSVIGAEIGRNQVDQAKGQEAMGTLDSNIANKNSGNWLSAMGNELQNLRVAGQANPAFAEAQYQEFKAKLPPQLQRMFPHHYVPEAVEKAYTTVADTIAQRHAMEKANADNASREKIAQGNNDASRYAADQRLAAAWARLPKGTQQKVENIVNQYLQMHMDGKQTTPQQDRAFQAAQQIMINVRQAAGMPMDPNAMGWQMMFPNQAPPPRPGPTPVQINPGQDNPQPQQTTEIPVNEAQAKAAFGQRYDPNYEYFSVNGRIGRRPKRR